MEYHYLTVTLNFSYFVHLLSFIAIKCYTSTQSIKKNNWLHILQWFYNSCIWYWCNIIGCHNFTICLIIHIFSIFQKRNFVVHILSKWIIHATYFNLHLSYNVLAPYYGVPLFYSKPKVLIFCPSLVIYWNKNLYLCTE